MSLKMMENKSDSIHQDLNKAYILEWNCSYRNFLYSQLRSESKFEPFKKKLEKISLQEKENAKKILQELVKLDIKPTANPLEPSDKPIILPDSEKEFQKITGWVLDYENATLEKYKKICDKTKNNYPNEIFSDIIKNRIQNIEDSKKILRQISPRRV